MANAVLLEAAPRTDSAAGGIDTGVVVMIDPYHDYAQTFIEVIMQNWGIRTVCLYTDRAEMYRHAYRYPALHSRAVAASYLVRPQDIAAIAPALAERHEVRAVIPHAETAVVPAAELAAALELDWAPPEIVRRFRDKESLKRHLRSLPNAPRMNASRLVRTPADVRDAIATGLFAEFVLKPNDGFGNVGIGFFTSDTPAGRIADFLAGSGSAPILMESRLVGDEFHVNGQIDAAGRVEVFAVYQYDRVSENGRPNVLRAEWKVDHSDPRFARLADYAASVVVASGLRRSPFHAEVILEAAGPCLVEIAARLCGADMAYVFNEIHERQLDVFEIAAHHYLSAADRSPTPIDWSVYDRFAHGTFYGVSHRKRLVISLAGVHAVQALPQFVRWTHRPRIGDALVRTTNLFGHPWAVALRDLTLADLKRSGTEVRWTLRVNGDKPTLRQTGQAVRADAARIGRAAANAPRMRPQRLPA